MRVARTNTKDWQSRTQSSYEAQTSAAREFPAVLRTATKLEVFRVNGLY